MDRARKLLHFQPVAFIGAKVNWFKERLRLHGINQYRLSKREFLAFEKKNHFGIFFEHCRISVHNFDIILRFVLSKIEKKDINSRKAIQAEERVSLTLR